MSTIDQKQNIPTTGSPEFPLNYNKTQNYYDGSGNLVQIDFINNGVIVFSHIMTYDVSNVYKGKEIVIAN